MVTRSDSPYDGGAATEGPESEILYCANHPNVPTVLRCGRCEKPICARCRVATPVGYRCIECAGLAVVPTYAVSTPYYIRAIAAGAGVATAVGLVWAVFPAFDFWAALILGLAVGEAVSLAANLKRGPGLQVIAVASVAWGILVSRVVLAFLLTIPAAVRFLAEFPANGQVAMFRGVTPGVFNPLPLFLSNDLVGWLFLAMALVLAYIRLR